MNNDFDFFQYYAQLNHEQVMLSYKGPITDVLLAEFSRDIRQKLQGDQKAGKKVFSVFMEMATNVLYYSKEINYFGSRDKVGTIVVAQTDKEYKLITGNMIYTDSAAKLIERCQIINSLDREGLREYKRYLRNNPIENEESRGAGIGLVQVAITADNNIEVKIKKISDTYSFFVLVVNIQKTLPNNTNDTTQNS
ncbi:MAG: SiaB family protein kinase [Microscillaceae bacterium]|nr:SiaB family protein kinase [Microscillaceae bacterium]MDW8460461.1 SiaB family protein kinase [Cytophagales bacterium]